MACAQAASEWNRRLAAFGDVSPFQSFEHGAAGAAEGWDPQFWALGADAMALVLFKRLPLSVGMFWVVGGPAGDLSKCGRELLDALCTANGVKRGYLRMRIDREHCGAAGSEVRAAGLSPSKFALTSGRTVELDLTAECIESVFSKNWKRSIRKAENNGLDVYRWDTPDAEALAEMLGELEQMKGVSVHFPKAKIESCIAHLADVFRVYRCDDSMGHMVAFRAAVVLGGRAVDLAAAANVLGRHSGASQYLVREMAQDFASEGVRAYELGGIDPENNPGVTRFKYESGGREVKQMGEWDIATSEFLRKAANRAIALRQKFQQGKVQTLKQFFTRLTTSAPDERGREKYGNESDDESLEKGSPQDIRSTEGVRRKSAA